MNAGCYEDRTCTRLKICFCTFWKSSHDGVTSHQIWSYKPMKLSMFCGLVCMGTFVQPYLLNPMTYGHGTCTVGCSKDWSLYRCVKVLWHSHQIWSCEPMNSTIFVRMDNCISWTLSPIDMELLPLDTAGIKNVFKHGDIPITFGAVSPWNKLDVSWFWTHW